jgi:hypothetical protein
MNKERAVTRVSSVDDDNIGSLAYGINRGVPGGLVRNCEILTVAEILDRNTESTIQAWFHFLQGGEKMVSVPMDYEQRCCHLPQVFRELISRLQSSQVIGGKGRASLNAGKHGLDRRRQGYSAAMLRSRGCWRLASFRRCKITWQASISAQLAGVMVIVDEVDSQLSQAMESFSTGSGRERRPARALVRPV